MKTYILHESINLKEIGNYPQCIEMEKGYNYRSQDSIYEIGYHRGEGINKKLNLNGIIMRKSAKPTDVISVTMASRRGFFINQRFINVLKEFNLCEHEYHKATVVHKDKNYDYFWLHLICDWRKYVDYTKSKFNLGHKNIVLSSYGDYLKFQEQYDEFKQLHSSKVTMLSEFDKTLDMFFVGQYSNDVVISDRLKNAIIENKITGVEIKGNGKIIV